MPKFEQLNLNLVSFRIRMGEIGVNHFALDAPNNLKWDGQTALFRWNIAGNTPDIFWNNWIKLVRSSYIIVGARLHLAPEKAIVPLNIIASPAVREIGGGNYSNKDSCFVFSITAKGIGEINDARMRDSRNELEFVFLTHEQINQTYN